MDTHYIEDGSILRNMFYLNTITSHFHVEGYSQWVQRCLHGEQITYPTLPHICSLTRDQKFNRLFVDDVNRVFEQFEALPDSANKKTFPDQVKAEHRARLPVCFIIIGLITTRRMLRHRGASTPMPSTSGCISEKSSG